MADTTIEWTERTWNPIVGCSLASPGCKHCYAMRMAGRLEAMGVPHYQGTTQKTPAGFVWTGKIGVNDAAMLEPLRRRKPTMWFVNSMSDLFHEDVPDAMIDQVFAVMALSPQHVFQVLTKRADRQRAYFADPRTCARIARTIVDWLMLNAIQWREPWPVQSIGDPEEPTDIVVNLPLPNVWLGVSVEDQRRANERVPDLMATPAAIRWLSCEPLLDFVDLDSAWHGETALDAECWGDCGWCKAGHPPLWNCQRDYGKEWEPGAAQRSGLDWIVVGGESGANARPMHVEAARLLRDQCQSAGVPFFFKQWGAYLPCGQMNADGKLWTNGSGHALLTTKKFAGRYLDGHLHSAMPAVAHG